MEHPEEPSLDTKVSHYRRLHRLGAGGMGEVYVGIDETLKRRVALKAVHPGQRLQAESKTRFLRETQSFPNSITRTSAAFTTISKTSSVTGWSWSSSRGRTCALRSTTGSTGPPG